MSETQDEELVWTFASWIMRIDPEKGTQIFCNRHESRSLMIKPDRVIDFFKSFESEGGAGALEWPTAHIWAVVEIFGEEKRAGDTEFERRRAAGAPLLLCGMWTESCVVNTARAAAEGNREVYVYAPACSGHMGVQTFVLWVMQTLYAEIIFSI